MDTTSTLNGSEPLYQGIIERDIGAIRQEAEIGNLKSELNKLKSELAQAQKNFLTLEDSEKMLRERLADEKHRSLTLEKMASLQKQKSLPKVSLSLQIALHSLLKVKISAHQPKIFANKCFISIHLIAGKKNKIHQNSKNCPKPRGLLPVAEILPKTEYSIF